MDVTPTTGPKLPKSDWDIASEALSQTPTRWGSLTWVSARPLIASLNHALALGARGLVTGLRRHWSSAQDPMPIELPAGSGQPDGAGTTFFLIGDTGEQDASQYVVAPALSAAAAQHHPDFVMIMSDVIYPSGDVNDYPDGVYRPYRSTDERFRVAAPLLALPGNHDWYDGLAGFMYHFVEGSKLPRDEVYAPAVGQGSSLSRLCRILWRRPSDPDSRTTTLRASGRLTGSLTQPGPYYVVDTPDLRVVCIDTGIDGTLDEQQGAWLRRVSAVDKAKILVTGKPLVVDEEIRRCPILPDHPEASATDLGTVWDVVQDPGNSYVATVGGDVHNFQHYERRTGDQGPKVHLVAGGGGAFLHATHTVSVGANDSRMRARPGREYYGPPIRMFPDRNRSLELFAGLLIPTLRRVMIYLSLLLIGAAAAVVVALNAAAAPRAGAWMAALAAAGLLGLLAVSAIPRLRVLPRSSWWSRLRTSLIMVIIGVLGVAVAALLDPARLPMFVGFVAIVMVLHAVASALIRQSGWWRPADEYPRNPRLPVFLLGLTALAMVVGLAQLVLGWSTDSRTATACAAASAVLLLAAGLMGWWCRRRRLTTMADGVGRDLRPELREPAGADRPDPARLGQQNRSWHLLGLPTGQIVQAVCVLLGIAQLLIMNGAASDLLAALGMILATLAAAAVFAGLVLLGWAAALLGLTKLTASVRRRRGEQPPAAWGAAAGHVGQRAVPLLLVMLLLLLAGVSAVSSQVPALQTDVLKAAAAPVTCLVVLVIMLLVVDTLRRAAPQRYLWYTLLVLGGVAAVGWLLSLVSATRWIVTYGSGAAIVLLAVGVTGAIGHLSFLGAYWLILDSRTRSEPKFAPQELEEIFRAREAYPPERPNPTVVPRHVQRWARITSPALGEPGGIVQKEVSEIFSSDSPPFYKSFLRLTTSRSDDGQVDLSVFLHRVYGCEPSDHELVATLRLEPPPGEIVPSQSNVTADA